MSALPQEVEELRRLLAHGEAELGELRLVAREPGIRLQGPGDAAEPGPSDPESFRRFIRFDGRGRYRPLTGACGLRGGWYLDCASLEAAAEWIGIVYPLALRHRAQRRAGRLRLVDADRLLSRQTSRYADAGALTGRARLRAVEALCGGCVREPCWAGALGEGIPCPEPCSVFVALAQAIAEWDPADPPAVPDPEVGFADFDQPGNPIRCRFLTSEPG